MTLFPWKQDTRLQSQFPKRYIFLDELRGFSLISMILFHLCWNIDNLLHIELAWYHTTAAQLWQLSICVVFLLLSGLCIHFTRHLLRHTLILAGSALLVTIATWFTGSHTLVVFGILHCMTLCFIFYLISRPLLWRVPPLFGLLLCLFLYFFTYAIPEHHLGFGTLKIFLPDEWYTSYWLSPVGLLSPDFYSSDYFPIFPNLFLFLAGYFLGRFPLPNWTQRTNCRPLSWLGQHSLIIYLLHQPVLYFCMLPFFPQ